MSDRKTNTKCVKEGEVLGETGEGKEEGRKGREQREDREVVSGK